MDQLKITKFEQSCITIEIDDTEFYVIDTGSETSMDKLLSLKKASATFVSHSHPDHFNSENLKMLNCPTYGAKEVVEGLKLKEIDAIELYPSSKISIGKINITPFLVDHGAISVPLVNFGFHIQANGKSILYLGDIAIPSPIPSEKFDLVIIPVGGGKVFDINQALNFIKKIGFTGTVIPMHFHGRADRAEGINFKLIASAYCNVVVLDIGESVRL